MKKFLALILTCAGCLSAENFVELRGAQNGYRYLLADHYLRQNLYVELFYVGLPGSDELNFGIGYRLIAGESLTLQPIFYAATVNVQHKKQRGAKVGVYASYQYNKWNINGFLGYFIPFHKHSNNYLVLDSLDLKRTLTKKWNLGATTEFFLQGGKWNPLVGPMLERTDKRGGWRINFLFGSAVQFRLIRSFNF